MGFLQQIIPVSTGIWIGCWVLPAVFACLWRVWCRRGWKQWVPLGIAAILAVCVILYRFTSFLAPVIGGFAALILLGTALALAAGSGVGQLLCLLK